jgi:exonuclease VII small subunit
MPKEKNTKSENLTESLKKLQNIVEWFDSQDEVDVETGLEKVREGAELIKKSRVRLKQIDNTFREIQKDMEMNDEDSIAGRDKENDLE